MLTSIYINLTNHYHKVIDTKITNHTAIAFITNIRNVYIQFSFPLSNCENYLFVVLVGKYKFCIVSKQVVSKIKSLHLSLDHVIEATKESNYSC